MYLCLYKMNCFEKGNEKIEPSRKSLLLREKSKKISEDIEEEPRESSLLSISLMGRSKETQQQYGISSLIKSDEPKRRRFPRNAYLSLSFSKHKKAPTSIGM